MLESIAKDIHYVLLKPVQGQWMVKVTLKDDTTASASGETVAKALKDLSRILASLKEQE